MVKINCDLCGKSDENLLKTIIEKVELNVCQDCSKFGKVIGPLKSSPPMEFFRIRRKQEEPEKRELIVENYSELVKKKRESLGLSQKDFAMKVSEKESLVHKIETGTFEPSIALAKKLEKILGIKLIEEYTESNETPKKSKPQGFTIGDFIKIKG